MTEAQKLKMYRDCFNKKCPYCNKDVTMKDIAELNFEMSKTKRKSTILVHKSCLIRR